MSLSMRLYDSRCLYVSIVSSMSLVSLYVSMSLSMSLCLIETLVSMRDIDVL